MPEITKLVPAKPIEQDLKERAFRTFVQAFLVIVVGAGVNFVDVALWKTALLSAVAAALAAVQTVLRERWGS